MSQGKYTTVQSFYNSLPAMDETDFNALPLVAHTASRCCSPCKVKQNATVRPILCSKVLSDITQLADRHYTNCNVNNSSKYYGFHADDAWVEHEKVSRSQKQMDNWERARQYNAEMENYQQEKASRLLEFQQEVKHRVKKMELEKQQAMLVKTYKDVELERKVAHKTAFLAQASIPNASDVMFHGRRDHIVKTNQFSQPQAHTDGVARYSEENLQSVAELSHSIEHERKMKRTARQKLNSRRLINRPDSDLPGGFWKDTSYVELPAPCDETVEVFEDEMQDTNTADLVVAAADMNIEDLEHSEKDKQIRLNQASHRPTAYSISISGQEEEEVRKQEVKQRALLRRLYMDIEREQVKEYKKMKSHLDRIAQIKRVKEEERSRQEMESAMSCSTVPLCPTPSLSDTTRGIVEQERQLRKQKESKRYIKALRSLLREKIDRLGIDVPSLCSCGDNIWDTHPDLCANNCPFYKNPKGYERAVQALLTSCDINE